MTNAQRSTLRSLTQRYNTVGLNRAELTRKAKLESQDALEVSRLANALKHWTRRHDTHGIMRTKNDPVQTVYVNSVI